MQAQAKSLGGKLLTPKSGSQSLQEYRDQLIALEAYNKRHLQQSKFDKFSALTSTPEDDKRMFEELALDLPAIIPDDPHGVIRRSDSVAKILDNSALVIERKMEMMTVFLVPQTHVI